MRSWSKAKSIYTRSQDGTSLEPAELAKALAGLADERAYLDIRLGCEADALWAHMGATYYVQELLNNSSWQHARRSKWTSLMRVDGRYI